MPKFEPGKSGNPGGRPKGATKLAKRIMEETREGDELIEYALAVFRDADSKPKDKRWAHRWLTERGFGKALQTIEVTPGSDVPGGTLGAALAEMTDEQLDALEALGAAEAAAGDRDAG